MSLTVVVNTFEPLGDQVVVRVDEVPEITHSEGGIALPDTARPHMIRRTGTIVATGPDCKRGVVGKRILFAALSGSPIIIGGEEFDVMTDIAVLGYIS